MSGRRLAAGLVALAAALAWVSPQAAAAPPPPDGLAVAGGGTTWSAGTSFQLTWSIPPLGGGQPLVAAHYRLRNPEGAIAVREAIAWTANAASVSATHGVPGVYTAEIWFEDAGGEPGPAASVQFRFDDVRPGPVEPLPTPEWLGRGAFPLRIRLAHPDGPPPLSGIRGYAVSIGSAATGAPCLAADRCSEAETTLHGGIGDDELTITALPEGTSHLHAVAVSGTGMKSGSSGHAVLRVDTTDPVVRLSGPPAGWTNRVVQIAARATDAGAGMTPRSGGPPPFTAIRVDDGAPTLALGATAKSEVVGEGTHRIAYYARDAAGNVNDGTHSNGVANRPPRTSWVWIDRTAPIAAFANSQDPRDPDLLRVKIADPLSGPEPARGWIGVRRAGSGDRFERLPVEPPSADELRARWHSDAYPRGVYEFRAVAYDAAGNTSVVDRRRDGSAMALSNPLKATTTLRARFHRGRLRRNAPFGRRIRVAGRLITGRNTPLVGMPVRVVERFAKGARPAVRVSTVRTGHRGHFAHRLGRGPTRKIEVSFAGTRTLARSNARNLELSVRSRVRLHTSSRVAKVGGAPILFRGRVATGGRTTPAPESVQLQFRLPGRRWTSFRTLKTNRVGRFHYRYSFSDNDSRGILFQFRAYVQTQENWPYEPGGSRPVLVRGK